MRLFYLYICLAVFACSMLAGCGRSREESVPPPVEATAPPPPPTVQNVPPPPTPLPAEPTPVEQPPSPLSPLSTPEQAPDTAQLPQNPQVTCTPQGEFFACTDEFLQMSFEYPAYMGTVAGTELRPGGFSGTVYEYQMEDGSFGTMGGRSRDFSEGRGGMYTDQKGFGDLTLDQICNSWGTPAICSEIKPGVVLSVILPQAELLCGDFMAPTTIPRGLIFVNLPQHPTIHGFGFATALLSPEAEAAMNAQLQDPSFCEPENKAAFDERMAQIRQGLDSGTAEAEIQTYYDGFLHLANSITGSYVSDERIPFP